MESSCEFSFIEKGEKLVKGDLSFYIEDYFLNCILTDRPYLTTHLDQPQSFS